MAQKKIVKKSTEQNKPASASRDASRPVWKKPRITRHGNMRQLTQMSG
jgi:hypothetical protein